jgi:dephospho-CoA kinase
MILVALTGGIGSGKSSVCERLERKGAVIIDSDALVKELQQPGGTIFEAMVAHFGDRIVAEDGTLDRQAVADIVFADENELAALNSIAHPALWAEAGRRVRAHADTDHVVIMDIPLLLETQRDRLHRYRAIIVVDTPVDVAVERLMTHRGFSEQDARNRIANQASREERLEVADFVVSNAGTPGDLDVEVEALWARLVELPHGDPSEESSAAPSASRD